MNSILISFIVLAAVSFLSIECVPVITLETEAEIEPDNPVAGHSTMSSSNTSVNQLNSTDTINAGASNTVAGSIDTSLGNKSLVSNNILSSDNPLLSNNATLFNNILLSSNTMSNNTFLSNNSLVSNYTVAMNEEVEKVEMEDPVTVDAEVEVEENLPVTIAALNLAAPSSAVISTFGEKQNVSKSHSVDIQNRNSSSGHIYLMNPSWRPVKNIYRQRMHNHMQNPFRNTFHNKESSASQERVFSNQHHMKDTSASTENIE